MNTNDIWIALATFGNARISADVIDGPDPSTYNYVMDAAILCMLHSHRRDRFRNQLNSEAALEGVSLRINSLADGRLDIYLRKFT